MWKSAVWRMASAQREEVLRAAGKIPSAPITAPDGSTHNRADAVIWWLERTYRSLSLGAQVPAPLSYSELEKRFHAIAAAADTLLGALGVPMDRDEADLAPQIGEPLRAIIEEQSRDDGDARFHQAVESLVLLRDAARNAKTVAAANKRKSAEHTARRRAETIGMAPVTVDLIDHVLGAILGIWTELLGREIRMSVNPIKGKATGPLIRFASACLKSLGLETTEDPSENQKNFWGLFCLRRHSRLAIIAASSTMTRTIMRGSLSGPAQSAA